MVPVLDQPFYTRVCLMSLAASAPDAEVVVVDNGSGEETRGLLQAWAAGAGEGPGGNRRLVRLDANAGFARGCNAGAGRAAGDVLVFLNNDTFVLEGWLAGLLRPLAEPDVAIAGSRLLYPDGTLQHAGVAFDPAGPHHVFVGLPGDFPPALSDRDLQAVTGASMAVRRAWFEDAGGFDTAYTNSFEDIDLCLRARAAGLRVVYAPGSVAYHFESVSAGRVGPTDMVNYDLFRERWAGSWTDDLEGMRDEARALGTDPEDRRPSRREMLDLVENRRELFAARSQVRTRSVRTLITVRDFLRRRLPHRTPA